MSIDKQTAEVIQGWVKAGLSPKQVKAVAKQTAQQYKAQAKGKQRAWLLAVAASYEAASKGTRA